MPHSPRILVVDDNVHVASLIGTQRLEQYEIAAHVAARTIAQQLGCDDDADPLGNGSANTRLSFSPNSHGAGNFG